MYPHPNFIRFWSMQTPLRLLFWLKKVVSVRCDPNYNVCLVGMPWGPTVRVMWLADLFPCLTAVSSVHPIYTYCKPYRKGWWLIVFPTLWLSHYSEDRWLALVVFSHKGFPRKNRVSCSILFSHYLLTTSWVHMTISGLRTQRIYCVMRNHHLVLCQFSLMSHMSPHY